MRRKPEYANFLLIKLKKSQWNFFSQDVSETNALS